MFNQARHKGEPCGGRALANPPSTADVRGAAAEYERLEVLYWLHESRRDLVRQSPCNDGIARGTLKIIDVVKGATTSHVRIEIGSGVVVTFSITNEAVADLGLKAGDDAWAVIKASDVMIGK